MKPLTFILHTLYLIIASSGAAIIRGNAAGWALPNPPHGYFTN
jgi:hypothetical protein